MKRLTTHQRRLAALKERDAAYAAHFGRAPKYAPDVMPDSETNQGYLSCDDNGMKGIHSDFQSVKNAGDSGCIH